MTHKYSVDIFKKPSILILIFSVCFSIIFMDLWRPWHLHKTLDSPFVFDVAHYYSYLPSVVNNNPSMRLNNDFDGFLIDGVKGDKMTKTTYGMSILYAPFYALGYKIAINQKNSLDGYSEPFATAIHWGSIFYGLLGLLFLRNFLIKYYSEKATAITLAIIFFGSNLFYYVLGQSEMTHGYLFMLHTAFLLSTYHWYKKISVPKTLLVGLLLGIISLIRPTEILIGLIFVFWMIGSFKELKSRLRLLLKNWPHLFLMMVLIILIWIPQFLFWHSKTGNYFYFSYPGERFFWTDPQIINILFSYRKGWFLYSPLIVLAFIGFIFMKDELKKLRWLLMLLIFTNIYMLSCWWDWFFGGSFGARGFVQHYSYLSIPIAALTSFILEKDFKTIFKPILQTIFITIVFLGICLNLGQSYQYNQGKIHFYGMNKKVYWYVFGKYKLSGEEEGLYWSYITEPNYSKLMSGEDRDQ